MTSPKSVKLFVTSELMNVSFNMKTMLQTNQIYVLCRNIFRKYFEPEILVSEL